MIIVNILYKPIKKKRIWSNIFNKNAPLSKICSSHTLTGYAALINISDRCSNPCLLSLGVCYNIKIYFDKYGIEETKLYLANNINKFTTTEMSYPWITEWVPERHTFVEYNYIEQAWNLSDSQFMYDDDRHVYDELCREYVNKDICDFFFVDNMIFNAGQQEVYVTDYTWYNRISNEIVIDRAISIKLDATHTIAFSNVLESVSVPKEKLTYIGTSDNEKYVSPETKGSKEILQKTRLIEKTDSNRPCVSLSNSDFQVESEKCHKNVYTESVKFDYVQLEYNMNFCGDECFICLGQMYIIEQIIKAEGLCNAITIINNNIGKFGSYENDYYPFIDVYNKLDETIVSKVNSRLDFINTGVKNIEYNIVEEIVKVQPDIDKPSISKHLTAILEKHPLRLFLDAFNGKQITEYVTINSETQEPILKRSLIRLFTLSNEPYNVYMVGVGYTLSFLKPFSYLD
jgi:hypothetical protein